MQTEPGLIRTRPLDEENMFRQFLRDFHTMRRGLRGRRRDAWQPPTDVYETDRDIVIKVCIPGVRPEQVAVECNGEVFTICGVRRGPDAANVRTYHQMEIRNGYFERRVVIHRPFDPSEAKARYEDGFLYVIVPKAAELVRHVITIKLSAP
jgi:HSP20 family protein